MPTVLKYECKPTKSKSKCRHESKAEAEAEAEATLTQVPRIPMVTVHVLACALAARYNMIHQHSLTGQKLVGHQAHEPNPNP